MKVELQISETYEEEKLIVQAPQPTDKVQKIWTEQKKSKGKSRIRSISLRLEKFSASISKIEKF